MAYAPKRTIPSAIEAVRPIPSGYQYDLAISFAGEDRELARRIAHVARTNGLKVFFDEYHLWELWGKNLSEYLGSVFGEGSRYCLILISEDYCRKPYTILERRIALARALECKEEYILPVVLDGSWLPGLPRTTAYLDLRSMNPTDIADAVIQKIKGEGCQILRSSDEPWPKFEVVDENSRTAIDLDERSQSSLVDFADIRIASECDTWAEGAPYKSESWPSQAPRWCFRGGLASYPDPILDITIINRSDAPRLLSRVGIEVLGASYLGYEGFGAGGSQAVHLHRTYQIPLPDVWEALALGQRAAKGRQVVWIDAKERSSCRLADPVLVDSGRAYRFGIHLFDYTSYCPTQVELLFWTQTDRGEARSGRVWMSYEIGSQISPVDRYLRMLGGPEEFERQRKRKLTNLDIARGGYKEEISKIAYALWKEAGCPAGRDLEFWNAAEEELRGRLLATECLVDVYKRPLEGEIL